MLESESEQTWEREDFQLHGEIFSFLSVTLIERRRVCVPAVGLWVLRCWHLVCPSPHHAPLCSPQTQKHFHSEHNAVWLREEGGRGQPGDKAGGWRDKFGRTKWVKICVLKIPKEVLRVVLTHGIFKVILSTQWPWVSPCRSPPVLLWDWSCSRCFLVTAQHESLVCECWLCPCVMCCAY